MRKVVKKTKIWSTLIIRNTAQKVMVDSGFGRRFHDLKYFEVGSFSHIS